MSIESSDAEAAAIATKPRVTLAGMEAKIAARYDLTADKAIGPDIPQMDSLRVLSICILVLENGFTLIGKSAPADAGNFNAEFGKKLAYEDAIRQLWPLEGYLLRTQLAATDDIEF